MLFLIWNELNTSFLNCLPFFFLTKDNKYYPIFLFFIMTMLYKLMESNFQELEILCKNSMSSLVFPLSMCVNLLVSCLKNNNKILACGNGGSAAEAQHFIAELIGRFEHERFPLAGIALDSNNSIMTAISNDYKFEEVFARQIKALGKSGDVLVVLSTSGNSKNILCAINAAHNCKMQVIALTGKGGGLIADIITECDIHLCVPSTRTSRVQEIHLIILHALCDGIDMLFLGEAK